jgi:uncharacterized membrane protein
MNSSLDVLLLFFLIAVLVSVSRFSSKINRLSDKLAEVEKLLRRVHEPEATERARQRTEAPSPVSKHVTAEQKLVHRPPPVERDDKRGEGPFAAEEAQVKEEEPSFLQRLFAPVLSFVRGGNIWVAGGVLMLLTGFAFSMTYMVEQGYFSVELRIALAAVCGMVMVGFGLRLRAGKPVYALIMQGGGIGVLYLSAFAAAKFSTLLPPAAALARKGAGR